MPLQNSLTGLSLDSLLRLSAQSDEKLSYYQTTNENPAETERYRKLVELIQKVMVAKKADERSGKKQAP